MELEETEELEELEEPEPVPEVEVGALDKYCPCTVGGHECKTPDCKKIALCLVSIIRRLYNYMLTYTSFHTMMTHVVASSTHTILNHHVLWLCLVQSAPMVHSVIGDTTT
jgi:hypothetical protein